MALWFLLLNHAVRCAVILHSRALSALTLRFHIERSERARGSALTQGLAPHLTFMLNNAHGRAHPNLLRPRRPPPPRHHRAARGGGGDGRGDRQAVSNQRSGHLQASQGARRGVADRAQGSGALEGLLAAPGATDGSAG